MTRPQPDGYVDRRCLHRLRETNAAMVAEHPAMNARLAQQLGRISLALAEQAQAIGAMEQLRKQK